MKIIQLLKAAVYNLDKKRNNKKYELLFVGTKQNNIRIIINYNNI